MPDRRRRFSCKIKVKIKETKNRKMKRYQQGNKKKHRGTLKLDLYSQYEASTKFSSIFPYFFYC